MHPTYSSFTFFISYFISGYLNPGRSVVESGYGFWANSEASGKFVPSLELLFLIYKMRPLAGFQVVCECPSSVGWWCVNWGWGGSQCTDGPGLPWKRTGLGFGGVSLGRQDAWAIWVSEAGCLLELPLPSLTD